MTTVAIIPARGGSKGIHRKNLVDLGGKPLIAWSISVALATRYIDRVIVSTDDEEIAAIGRTHGAEIPFLRPAALAADDSTDQQVYKHALDQLRKAGEPTNKVVWLRPTCPFRTSEDISQACAMLETSGADLVRSVCRVEHHPYWMKILDGTKLLPFLHEMDELRFPQRQLLPPCHRLNGAVDVFRVRGPEQTLRLYEGDMRGFEMPLERSVDIDSPLDLEFARALIASGLV